MTKSEIETRFEKITAQYLKAGGTAARLIALVNHIAAAHGPKPRTEPPPFNPPSVRPPDALPPQPASVFDIRIGTRVIGTVRLRECANLADRAQADMRLWAKLADYASKNKLNEMDTVAVAIPARVLVRFLRETNQTITAAG